MSCVYIVISLMLCYMMKGNINIYPFGKFVSISSLIQIQTYSAHTLQLYNLTWGILMCDVSNAEICASYLQGQWQLSIQFSIYRSLVSLGRYIPKYLIPHSPGLRPITVTGIGTWNILLSLLLVAPHLSNLFLLDHSGSQFMFFSLFPQ